MGRPRAFGLRDLWIVLDAGGREFAGQGSARGSRGPDRVGRAVRPGHCRGSRPQGEGLRAADRPMQGWVARGVQDRPGDRENPTRRPVTPSARPKLKTLPSHRAGQRSSCSAGKAEALPGPFKDPEAIQTNERMPVSKVLQTA